MVEKKKRAKYSYRKAITTELKFKMTTLGSEANIINTSKWDHKHAAYLFGIHVEFLSAHGHLLIPLHIFPVKIKMISINDTFLKSILLVIVEKSVSGREVL